MELSSALETSISSTLPFLCQADEEEIILPLTSLIMCLFLGTLCKSVRPSQKAPKKTVEEQGIEFLRPSVTRGNSIPKAGCQLTPRNRLLSSIVALEYPLSTNATSLKLGFQAGKCSHSIRGPPRDCEVPLLYLWLLSLLSNCMIRLIWKVTCSSQGTIFLVAEGILTLPTGLCLCREVL